MHGIGMHVYACIYMHGYICMTATYVSCCNIHFCKYTSPPHVWISHIEIVKESCHAYKWVISHASMKCACPPTSYETISLWCILLTMSTWVYVCIHMYMCAHKNRVPCLYKQGSMLHSVDCIYVCGCVHACVCVRACVYVCKCACMCMYPRARV